MAHIFHNPNKIKLPKSQHEVEEFSSGKGIVLCSTCGAAHFKKRWYHGLEKLNFSEKNDLPIKSSLCPACTMIKNKQYEGRITIKNLPDKYIEQLQKLAEGFGKRAHDRDPMDRVIEIKRNPSTGSGQVWEITTTENELANKLAHKIKDTFNVKSRTKFVPEPSDVSEVVIDFSR